MNISTTTNAALTPNISKPAFLQESVSMGVDIVDIEKMRAILARTPSFAQKVFSNEERAYCDATSSPVYHYATRFAAKEAVLKALGTGFSQGISPRDVEVILNAQGKPKIKLHRNALRVACEMRIKELPLSLSYTHREAVACALALKQDDAKSPKPLNPTEELTRQFKQARQMLDNLDVESLENDTQPSLFDSDFNDSVPAEVATLHEVSARAKEG